MPQQHGSVWMHRWANCLTTSGHSVGWVNHIGDQSFWQINITVDNPGGGSSMLDHLWGGQSEVGKTTIHRQYNGTGQIGQHLVTVFQPLSCPRSYLDRGWWILLIYQNKNYGGTKNVKSRAKCIHKKPIKPYTNGQPNLVSMPLSIDNTSDPCKIS